MLKKKKSAAESKAKKSIDETAYLLGTEANAEHLRKSLASAYTGKSIQRKLLSAINLR